MRADPARCEERYRLTGATLGLASALLAVGLGFLWHTQLIFAALTVLAVIPAVLAVARRPVAFRADHAGITLGSDRLLPRRPAVFIPWTDVERIVLHPGRKAPGLATISGPAESSSTSASSAGTEPWPCLMATSRLPAARSLASRPGRPGRSRGGGSIASG
jgi:hypothetical protein